MVIQMNRTEFIRIVHLLPCAHSQLYVIGTPGQRGHQVSLMVRGWITNGDQADDQKLGQIAITGNLFTDRTDASRVSFFDALEGNHGDSLGDKENSINCWRRSRQYVLDRADWIIPEYGEAFKGFKLFLGITPTISKFSAAGDEFSLILDTNPLTDFVDLPPKHSHLLYSNVLAGAIRGALHNVSSVV
ncbi:trafficking protein particle complex subunit 3 [Paragonimus westermani]|uniref:Trafficking protein particle complex subunit 3 n=1 Tax=Paragonimus westermani TaxID=34504 RepID=A0A5J4NAL3_9TREM|nr:trafficking protein particle complex subunit 3 [Paragonimus westermani]